MPFTPNPFFERELRREQKMAAFLGDIADEGASEVQRRLPYPRILGGLDVSGRVVSGRDGFEGEVRVKGSGWHLWEFGTSNHGARPAIRPGVQAALSRRGGRLGESR